MARNITPCRGSDEFLTFSLPNGIRCMFKFIDSSVAYTAVSVNAGSRDETASEHGLAHFTEHCLFKGTAKKSSAVINSRLEKLGGDLNAFTTKEDTVIHAVTLLSDGPKAAELISDILFNSTFPEKELAMEREIVLDEINSYRDCPADMLYDEFEDLLFAGSSLGHNILGDAKAVKKFNKNSITEFTNRCHTTDQIVFSMAARMSGNQFRKIAEKYFGTLGSSRREFGRGKPDMVEPFQIERKMRTHQAHCIIGSRAYSHKDNDRVAFSLLMNIIGGPAANSLMNTILREKYGLSYNTDAFFTPYSDCGIAAMYFGTDKSNVERSKEVCYSILDKISRQPFTPRQLQAHKKQFLGQLAISMESKEGYMLGAAKSLMVYGEIDSPQTIYNKIEAVTADDLLRCAGNVFGRPSSLLFI